MSFPGPSNSAEYRLVRKLGEGTFSEVLKAESVTSKQKVAIKCMKSHFDNIEQVRKIAMSNNHIGHLLLQLSI